MLGLKIEVRVNVIDDVTMCHESFSVLVLVDKFNQILPSLSYYRLRAVLASAEFPRNFVFDHSVFVMWRIRIFHDYLHEKQLFAKTF